MNRSPIKVGDTFGRLTVSAWTNKHDDHGRRYVLCTCECGCEILICPNTLPKRVSCGCARRKFDRKEAAVRIRFSALRRGAKMRKLAWKITPAEFAEITSKPCAYCGCKGLNRAIKQFLDAAQPTVVTLNGLDRVDNSRGYELDNVKPCCKACNYAKHTRSLAEFVDWVRRVHTNLKLGDNQYAAQC